jgi:hypothetical protein
MLKKTKCKESNINEKVIIAYKKRGKEGDDMREMLCVCSFKER